ncbi:hypothetical protein, partial [Paenibacillus sp. 32O-W]|uniref:hypothetical protein n=1 Tax=Paenibacillus sp. 32O-W TaxID=1695218 RepID=UPI001C930AD5
GDVVGVFPSRVHTCYLTRPRLGRSKNACFFPVNGLGRRFEIEIRALSQAFPSDNRISLKKTALSQEFKSLKH